MGFWRETCEALREMGVDQDGQAMAEYVIIITIIVGVMSGFFFSMREAVQAYYSYVAHILCLPFP